MSNQKKQNQVQQLTDVKVFGLVDGQGMPQLENEGIILAWNDHVFALSRDSFEHMIIPCVSNETREQCCIETWNDHFGLIEGDAI